LITRILIANRGEIAVRIDLACAEMGIRSVAVYSDADRHALHVKRADEAHSIGADPLAGYLNPRKLVNLAVETGCDALHPGYGFLSENAELADICAERGIKFIGPSAEVIRRMGDKTEARRSMIKAGVPVTPGTEGNVSGIEEALTEGDRIGYPVMLKATSGGGGRGIRRCNSREELEQAFPRVISEATKAFGSAEVFLEKCIVNPKHIEAQILGDSFGNVVHLFERDCSIQRRNQKLIEIAPSPQLTPEQRAYIGDLSVRAAKAVGCENAGTVEFLLAEGEVYFMEMNTRVQVEHTITEEITGIDIVRSHHECDERTGTDRSCCIVGRMRDRAAGKIRLRHQRRFFALSHVRFRLAGRHRQKRLQHARHRTPETRDARADGDPWLYLRRDQS